MKFRQFLLVFLLGSVALGLTACGGGATSTPEAAPAAATKPQTAVTSTSSKAHPGHYVVVAATDTHAQLVQLGNSNRVQGIVKHYAWNELEPSMGSYDFSQIRADLAEAALQKKYLLVQIDMEPRTNNKVIPEYLWQNQMVLPLQPGVQTLKIWDGYVIDRLKGLYAELAAHLAAEAYFEGLIIQPPGVQLNDQTRAKYAYTVESHRDAIIDLLNSTKTSFVTANVFWSFASMTANQKLDNDIATAVVGRAIVMGGADLRPENPSWQTIYQPLYSAMKGRTPLFAVFTSANDPAIKSAAKSQSQAALLQSAREREVKYLLWEAPIATPVTATNPYAEILSVIEASPN
jgi:hypothetical protein